MATQTGRITLGLTGLRSYNLGMQPTWIHLECVSDDSTSSGNADGTRQNVLWTFDDNATRDSDNINTHVVNLTHKVSGSVVPRVQASFDSFTATGFKLNVQVADSSLYVNILYGN